MSKKRQRDKPAVDTQLVEIYEDLANVDEGIRLNAAHTLLATFVLGGKADSELLTEILRRLFRGLCSGRKAARLGFSIALTEFLNSVLNPGASTHAGFPDIPGVIDILQKQTHIAEGADGQENRDHRIGRLFGAEAIVKSGILFQSTEGQSAWEDILDCILDLAKKKTWLREQCGFVLYNTLEIIGKQAKGTSYAQCVIDKLHGSGLLKTPEGVVIWIAARSQYQSIQFPKGVWHGNDPLHRKEKTKLAAILNEATLPENGSDTMEAKPLQKGSWSANVHFAWRKVILELVKPKTESVDSHSKRLKFEDFWNECVEDNLFKASASKERKYWGFLLFEQVISEPATQHLIPALFTPNLMQCLLNHVSNRDRYLHRAAERVRKHIIEQSRADPRFAERIMITLLGKDYLDFDTITKTKTVDVIQSALDASGIKHVVQLYDRLILDPGTIDEKKAASKRHLVADNLLTLMRSLELHDSESSPDVVTAPKLILNTLAKHAYFEAEAQGLVAIARISASSREVFKVRLSSCLTHIVAKASDAASICSALVHDIRHEIPGDGNSTKVLLDADSLIQDVLQQTEDRLERITKKNASKDLAVLRSASLLFSLAYLQVLNGDADAISILDELNNFFTKDYIKHCHEKGSSASSVVIEILLSFVSKPSQLFRRLAQQVFDSFASSLDETGLQSMLKVLETRENAAGQADVFDQVEDEGNDVEEVSDASDSEEADSDVEMLEADSETSSLADNSEMSNGPDEELAAFDAKLAEALGTRPGHADLTAGDSSSSTDEDMDDDQMAALDGHLEQVFREQKKATSKKAEKKDAKETIINFKCRVLDLLEIYVKKQNKDYLALQLLLPLLILLRRTTSPLVASKAGGVVREYTRLCKGQHVPQIRSVESAFELLKSVHGEAIMEGSNAHSSACSQASLLLVRILAADDRDHLRRVINVYASTQEQALFDTKCRVKMAFFTDWLNWVNTARKYQQV